MLSRTYYQVLGLPKEFTEDEMMDAWRNLTHRLHPDKGGDPDAFAEVSAAHEVLVDLDRRRVYEIELVLTTDRCDRCSGSGRAYDQFGFARRYSGPCPVCNGCGRILR